jgi:hypothetical protein
LLHIRGVPNTLHNNLAVTCQAVDHPDARLDHLALAGQSSWCQPELPWCQAGEAAQEFVS